MKKIVLVTMVLISNYISSYGQDYWIDLTAFPGTAVHDIVSNAQGNLFVSTNSEGVVFSSDNGITWVEKNNGMSYFTAYGLIVDHLNNIYRTPNSYKSTNNGDNWVDISNGNTDITASRVFAVSPNNDIYTEGYNNTILSPSGPYKSTDQGGTWITLGAIASNNYRGIRAFGFGSDGSVFVSAWADNSVYDYGVYKSTDGGSTWGSISTFYKKVTNKIATSPLGYLFIADDTRGVYFSSDNGANWIQKNNGLTNLSVRDIFISGQNNIYIATGNGVYKSSDNGDNWGIVDISGLTSTNLYSVIINNGYLYTAPYSGTRLFRSQNIVEQDFWIDLTAFPGTAVHDIVSNAQGNLFVSTNSEGVVFSSDNGITWVEKNNGMSYFTAYGLIVDHLNNIYRTPNSYKSTNNGDNWVDISNGNTDITASRVFAVSPNNDIYTEGYNNTILSPSGPYKSTDQGGTWITLGAIASNNYRGIRAFGFGSDGSVFVSAWADNSVYDYGVYKSTDGGSTWGSISTFYKKVTNKIATSPLGYLFIADDTRGVYFSSDNGANWIQKNNGLTNLSVRDIFISGQNNIYIATGNGVYKSSDNGDNWGIVDISGLTSTNLYSVIINNGYLYTAPYSGTRLFRSQNIVEQNLYTVTVIYPNGGESFTGGQNIQISWTKSPEVELSLIYISRDGGITFTMIGSSEGTTLDWLVTEPISNICRMEVIGRDILGTFSVYDLSDDNFSIVSQSTFSLSVLVENGWNIVSAPGINPAGMGVNNWWPNLTGTVWAFTGTVYQARTVTTPGEGYWMKNTLTETYSYPAIQIVAHDAIPGHINWNIIGIYEDPVPTSGLTTNPGGQITGTVWGFNGTTYQNMTGGTLQPGYGYWVKLLSACDVIIPEALAKGSVEEVAEYYKSDWGKIMMTDAAGISFTLYAVNGDSPNGGASVDLDQYEMPPAPPVGSFDIRYSSGRVAEDINSSMKTIDLNGITYPLTVSAEGMDIRLQDVTGKAINQNLKSGESVVINDATIQKLMVSGELMPTVYALEQNYPNPFNPSTVIEFSLPEDVSNAKLSVYNVLGEKVAELVNTNLTAGRYSYQWNAKNVATGMYIYELRTDKFVSIKKMILVK